jgi:hypothetical protein
MIRSYRCLVLAAAASLACATPAADLSDSTAASTHDPALHDAHMGAQGGAAAATDTSFAAMQARGATGMGVDQYTSTHTFEPRPDGGRITLVRDVEDSAGVDQIRAHLRAIATAFAAGDFTTPAFVHSGEVPGTDVMSAKRAQIHYRADAIPRGGELIMQTSDSAALDAIHRFLAYQRREHRTGG